MSEARYFSCMTDAMHMSSTLREVLVTFLIYFELKVFIDMMLYLKIFHSLDFCLRLLLFLLFVHSVFHLPLS